MIKSFFLGNKKFRLTFNLEGMSVCISLSGFASVITKEGTMQYPTTNWDY